MPGIDSAMGSVRDGDGLTVGEFVARKYAVGVMLVVTVGVLSYLILSYLSCSCAPRQPTVTAV